MITVVVMMAVRKRVHLESSDHNLPVLVGVLHENKITDVLEEQTSRGVASTHSYLMPRHIRLHYVKIHTSSIYCFMQSDYGDYS